MKKIVLGIALCLIAALALLVAPPADAATNSIGFTSLTGLSLSNQSAGVTCSWEFAAKVVTNVYVTCFSGEIWVELPDPPGEQRIILGTTTTNWPTRACLSGTGTNTLVIPMYGVRHLVYFTTNTANNTYAFDLQ